MGGRAPNAILFPGFAAVIWRITRVHAGHPRTVVPFRTRLAYSSRERVYRLRCRGLTHATRSLLL